MKTLKTNTGKMKAFLFVGFLTILTISCEDRAMEELRQVSEEIYSAPAIPSEPNAATGAELPPVPPAPPVPIDPGPLEKEGNWRS